MIICAPRPRERIRHDDRDRIPTALLPSNHSAQKKTMFSMAVTLRIRFDQGSESLEHPCLEVPKHRSPAQHTVRVALEPALGALSARCPTAAAASGRPHRLAAGLKSANSRGRALDRLARCHVRRERSPQRASCRLLPRTASTSSRIESITSLGCSICT
jgi:hypothetical protein